METAMERWRSFRHRLAVLGLVLPLIIVSCSRPAPYRRVNLTPVPQQVPTLAAAGELPALRLAVAAILSPQRTAHDYTGLIAYLSNKLGRPLRLVQGSTYAETNEMLRTGQADLGFLCTGAYVQGQRDFDMELLVIPQVNGEIVYRSYIVVRADSPAQRLQDLRGGVFAFTDPLSLSGYMVPLALLRADGETASSFFDRTLFTYSHDKSIQAVANGWVDGVAVDSLVYEALVAQSSPLVERTRVIWRSEAFGAPPVVVRSDLDASTKEQLRRALLGMAEDEEGREALTSLGVDRFVPADDRLYDSARAWLRALGGTR